MAKTHAGTVFCYFVFTVTKPLLAELKQRVYLGFEVRLK